MTGSGGAVAVVLHQAGSLEWRSSCKGTTLEPDNTVSEGDSIWDSVDRHRVKMRPVAYLSTWQDFVATGLPCCLQALDCASWAVEVAELTDLVVESHSCWIAKHWKASVTKGELSGRLTSYLRVRWWCMTPGSTQRSCSVHKGNLITAHWIKRMRMAWPNIFVDESHMYIDETVSSLGYGDQRFRNVYSFCSIRITTS